RRHGRSGQEKRTMVLHLRKRFLNSYRPLQILRQMRSLRKTLLPFNNIQTGSQMRS
ncbi:hypothetical protein M9458_034330, partial [Cirrhinus mrigala]